jgi:Ca-activated chloride channel family protein
MLTFAYSWVFWLAPLPLLVRWFLPPLQSSVPSIRVPFLSRLEAAGSTPVRGNTWSGWQVVIQSVVWSALLVALGRPQWLEPPIERTVPARDLLLMVDLSASMDQEDFTDATGKAVNRLDCVKEVVGDFLEKREGDRVGLVVFGNSPFLQVPFTTDLSLCRQLLDETAVGMAGPRTALGDAIGLGIHLLDDSTMPQKTMIVLTDGNDTASGVPPVEAARIARDRSMTIHTIAIGDPTTVGENKIDEEALRNVAETTNNGDFFRALNRDELEGIYKRLDELETRKVNTVSHRPRRDLYYWPVALPLLISLGNQTWLVLFDRMRQPKQKSNARLRVNTRTFELETSER